MMSKFECEVDPLEESTVESNVGFIVFGNGERPWLASTVVSSESLYVCVCLVSMAEIFFTSVGFSVCDCLASSRLSVVLPWNRSPFTTIVVRNENEELVGDGDRIKPFSGVEPLGLDGVTSVVAITSSLFLHWSSISLKFRL